MQKLKPLLFSLFWFQFFPLKRSPLKHSAFLLIGVSGVMSCGGGVSDGSSDNNAPIATEVNVVDTNAGYAVVADSLTASYTYFDEEGDAEGTSTFRWLRNGEAIDGATALTYTLVAADVAANIVFEVTPVASTGIITGSAVQTEVLVTGTPPEVDNFAHYLDVNNNRVHDQGDLLVVSFDQPVNINNTVVGDFTMPVDGDSFGSDATVSAGPQANQVTITLGASPQFNTYQMYAGGTTSGASSGIDVYHLIMPGSIQGDSGFDAQASDAVDIMAAYVDTEQELGELMANAMALGDVDGDGDVDVVSANAFNDLSGAGNTVWLNDGDGNFVDSGQLLGRNISSAIALADLDRDEDLDMVVANREGRADRIYINDGLGSFTDSNQALGAYDSRFMVLGDVNGDKTLDVVVAHADGQGNRIYLNNGLGSYSDTNQVLGEQSSLSIALGDVDGDGDLDIVVGNDGLSGDNVFSNDGSGIFTDTEQTLGVERTNAVVLGDVDGDSDLDLIATNGDAQSNRLYINDGSGVFTASVQSFGLHASNGAVFEDVDRDGDIDVLFANGDGSSALEGGQLFINDGAGIFADSGLSLCQTYCRTAIFGDLDGDGGLDLVQANHTVDGGSVVGGPTKVYLHSLLEEEIEPVE